jgi:succinylarginine dihydrolase
MSTQEYNFDGLIGPTHNYAGLAFGNVASTKHQHQPSQPRAAALQGLQKMRLLASLGVGQYVLPPLRRPRVEMLRRLGFSGSEDAAVIESAYRESPFLVAACFSAASMWAANAATVSPSADTSDQRLHLTPANLTSTLHRSLEGPSTMRLLRSIFVDQKEFQVHAPLPAANSLNDEGAANHTRLTSQHGDSAIEVFVYGKLPEASPGAESPKTYPARQSLLASQSIARNHQLDFDDVVFIQQNPQAIDAGVFHNDVISVGNENVLLCHEMAFVNQSQTLASMRERFRSKFEQELFVLELSSRELPLEDAVRSYLFNSQLVTLEHGCMILICPIECQEIESSRRCTERILAEDNPVRRVEFINLRQSMNNGGGPACLRLRVVMNENQKSAVHSGVHLTDALADELEAWIKSHYREFLSPEDLCDPNLIDETLVALESLADILDLPRADILDME